MAKQRGERICYTCQKGYRYCPHCSEFENMPSYMYMFCSQNCNDIWYTLSNFEDGVLSKEDAQAKMSTLDTSAKDKYIGCVKDSWDKLYGTTKVETKSEDVDSKKTSVTRKAQSVLKQETSDENNESEPTQRKKVTVKKS